MQLENPGATPPDWISSFTYESRATSRPTVAGLRELANQAQQRNHSLGVTGMLLYDRGRFFQTLEGPPAHLKQLWESIIRDPRHTDVTLLSEHIIPSRLFDGWDLLSFHGDDASPATVQDASAQHGLIPKVPGLIDLVLKGDDTGINQLMASLTEAGWEGNAILTHLIEPTARALGDAWRSDDCSELDLTIGLSMLQLAGHAVRQSPTPQVLRQTQYSILLATAPGERHSLGTSLLADLFTDAGWQVDMVFPDSNQALANQLAAQQPDAVDIGTSDAVSRQHTLVTMRETIERSRFAAPEQLTVVSVGGRVFTDAAATAQSVGADHARTTVAGASIRIAELIRQKRQEHGSR